MDDVLTNMNVFVDGTGYFGKCSTLTPPKPKVKTEKYRAGGMDMPHSIDMGMEGMECSAGFRGISADYAAKFGIAEGSSRNVPMTFRGSLQNRRGAAKGIVINVRGPVTEIDWGEWKAGEETEVKLMMEPSYYKCTIDGRVVHEIDAENAIRIIDGVDQLAAMRQALGV